MKEVKDFRDINYEVKAIAKEPKIPHEKIDELLERLMYNQQFIFTSIQQIEANLFGSPQPVAEGIESDFAIYDKIEYMAKKNESIIKNIEYILSRL